MEASPYQHATLDYSQIASVAWEAMRLYAQLEGDGSLKPWGLLTGDEQEAERIAVAQLIANPGFTPEKFHETLVREAGSQGWTFGYVHNDELKQSPEMVPWDEIPALQRNKEITYWHAVVSIGIAAGKINAQELHLAVANEAAQESKVFFERLNDGQ